MSTQKIWLNLIVESNMEAFRAGVCPFTHGSKVHTDLMKTQALLHALDKYKFDAAFGGLVAMKKSHVPKNVSSPSVTNFTSGIPKTSVRNFGTYTIPVSAKEKVFVYSR